MEEGGAAPAAEAPRPATSERIFRTRLTGALKKGSVRELRAILHDPQLEPHMTLFLLLLSAVAVGVLIWAIEPLLI